MKIGKIIGITISALALAVFTLILIQGMNQDSQRRRLIDDTKQYQADALKKLIDPVQEALKIEYSKRNPGWVSLSEYSGFIATIPDNTDSPVLFIVLNRAVTFMKIGLNERDPSYGRLSGIQDALNAYGETQDALRNLEANEKANLDFERDNFIRLRAIFEWHLRRLGL